LFYLFYGIDDAPLVSILSDQLTASNRPGLSEIAGQSPDTSKTNTEAKPDLASDLDLK